jgi:hypothetical protein
MSIYADMRVEPTVVGLLAQPINFANVQFVSVRIVWLSAANAAPHLLENNI